MMSDKNIVKNFTVANIHIPPNLDESGHDRIDLLIIEISYFDYPQYHEPMEQYQYKLLIGAACKTPVAPAYDINCQIPIAEILIEFCAVIIRDDNISYLQS